MKKCRYILLGLCFFLCGCAKEQEMTSMETEIPVENSEIKSGVNTSLEEISTEQIAEVENEYIINDADYSEIFGDLTGCAVIYDFNTDEYLVYNEEIANERYSPYSTFKIVSSLMGLHNGVLIDSNSQMNYSGTLYPIENWNSNLTFEEAFNNSCIWYFKQVIDAVGMSQVQTELNNLSYGNCDVSEWNGSEINPMDDLNGFWLGSSLKISPMEQIQVMRKIFGGDSIYTEGEVDLLQDVMLYDEVRDYSIYGKTGSNQNKEGWYVGVIESEQDKMCFAIYIESDEPTEAVSGYTAREIIKEIVGELRK